MKLTINESRTQHQRLCKLRTAIESMAKLGLRYIRHDKEMLETYMAHYKETQKFIEITHKELIFATVIPLEKKGETL
jgi:hypothetical protein